MKLYKMSDEIIFEYKLVTEEDLEKSLTRSQLRIGVKLNMISDESSVDFKLETTSINKSLSTVLEKSKAFANKLR